MPDTNRTLDSLWPNGETRDYRSKKRIDKNWETLTENEASVIEGRWFGSTLQEIGNEIGVSRQRVSQIEIRALIKLEATG